MNIHNPESWAELLLDIGKKNRLINSGANRTAYAEMPTEDAEKIPEYAERGKTLVLSEPETILRNIQKKARLLIEETGVNAAYAVLGTVVWHEPDAPTETYTAPLLLIPVHIERRSVAEPFCIRFEEDAPTVNPSFSYKLTSEYGITLPEYAHEGFEAYRKRVEDILQAIGWHTEPTCGIGLFSFHKENMYRDLIENKEAFLSHPNVQKLMGLGEGGEEQETPPPTTSNLHLIFDADACQTEAVKMARSGKSFVLQGPPGSGKSQTIANIIAQAMCDGKRVLFVSEKLAALRVVYEKMERAGLDGFCTELHSHRSNKKQFIDKLCTTIKSQPIKPDREAERVGAERDTAALQLSTYTNELHIPREGIEKSLFELLEAYEAFRDTPDCDIAVQGLGDRNADSLAQAVGLCGELADLTHSLGEDWYHSAWRAYTGSDPAHGVGRALRDDLTHAAEALKSIKTLTATLPNHTRPLWNSVSRANGVWQLCRLFTERHTVTPALLEKNLLLSVIERIFSLRTLAGDIKRLKNEIEASYLEAVFEWKDAHASRAFLKTVAKKGKRLFSRRYHALAAKVKEARRDQSKPTYGEVVELFDRLVLLQARTEEFEKTEKTLKALFGKNYRGLDSDWSLLLEDLRELAGLLERMPKSETVIKLFREPLGDSETLNRFTQTLAHSFETANGAFERIGAALDPKILDFANVGIDQSLAFCEACLGSFVLFEPWCRFNRIRPQAEAMGLMPFVEETVKRKLPMKDLGALYSKAFFRQWIDRILSGKSDFARFSGIALSRTAQAFAALDETLLTINRAYVKNSVLLRRGDLPESDTATILREGEKKRRQKSIRAILTEMGKTVAAITPCFFMSPLSVGTFLGEGSPHFDTVIFDEASQIFPQDALGAIRRADQLIVVGDSKQMPPENFFESTVGDAVEPEGEQASDYESILDLSSAVFPVRSLKWHYRSRSETLIAFSNRAFYNGELVTFPAAVRDGKDLGIGYHLVDGCFEHGKRVNQREAEYTVDLIYRHIKETPERSLGVVAFSSAQQEFIERLLAKRRRSEPDAEFFFSPERSEPFFIKNLETVQGDERDCIIFSVAYAKDKNGKLLQNFGPLNREGGERRINVAVTRAKYRVELVTSVKAADITPPREIGGVAALRDYLAYAEQAARNGKASEEEKNEQASTPEQAHPNTAFETNLCRFLEKKGYKTEQRVGNSRYPIDIALIDPESGNYVMAIETDGQNYRALENTSDQNRLRPVVLERMGWKHYRLWSADFLCGGELGKARLLEAVQTALAPNDQ